jgi:hypothetical protein
MRILMICLRMCSPHKLLLILSVYHPPAQFRNASGQEGAREALGFQTVSQGGVMHLKTGVDFVAVDMTNLPQYDDSADAIQLRPLEVC